MTQQASGYRGYGILYPQKSAVGFKYVRIVTEGSKKIRHADGSFEMLPPHPTIAELVDGGFCYASGRPVTKRDDLNHLPPGMKEKALAWFDNGRGISEAAIEKTPEPQKRAEPNGPWVLSSEREDIITQIDPEVPEREKVIRATKEPVVDKSQNAVMSALDAIMGKLGGMEERLVAVEKGQPKDSPKRELARRGQSEFMKARWAKIKAAKVAEESQAGGLPDGAGQVTETDEGVQAV